MDFPYSNHTEYKTRPALVVQADSWNQRLNATILAGITSSSHRRVGANTQYYITLSTTDGELSGLRHDSVVQCDKLITYNQNHILRVIGRLSQIAMKQIDVCLKSALGIQ
ncbi:MAG: type II toxin-antitoxin system PemK/MazF family toxin [Candidatus Poribacteria bacterium]|nr:type II toxin-antitoxin system PemK/MazF family toxin [Candidatus Poribacteria bacterium]